MHARSINNYRLRQIQKKHKKNKRLLIATSIFVSCFIIFILCFYFKIFHFHQIIISGNNLVSILEVYNKFREINNNQKLFKILNLSGNMIFWDKNLCNDLKEASVAIKFVNCQKNLLNKTIRISLEERQPIFLFYDEVSNKYFYLDEEGVLFYQLNFNNKQNLILINNKGNNIYRLGDKLAINFKQIFDLTKLIQKEFDLKYFNLTNQDIIAVCEGGFEILINLNKLSETQKLIPKLIESGFDLNNLEYLDLRFLPKIYYK